jgi:hypothetical protein
MLKKSKEDGLSIKNPHPGVKTFFSHTQPYIVGKLVPIANSTAPEESEKLLPMLDWGFYG